MTATFDRNRCAARNKVAARMDGIEAMPLRFLRQAGTSEDNPGVWSRGTLPADDTAALARINALRPGLAPLTAEQVYLHTAEAANATFIPDRFMFMDASTLKNIASDGTAGVAFMNSHRTGGLSHPAELPFGRTYAGRYEKWTDENGSVQQRSLLAFYMLAGQHPAGTGGPSTDALHAGIDGGTIFDVSVGLYGGTAYCDVCGEDINAVDPEAEYWDDYYLCPHVPGTTEAMTQAEINDQTARGVPGGCASYTLTGARCGEVSAVFDGAVPGAGFRKAVQFARKGHLSPTAHTQAGRAYASLSRKGDFRMSDIDLNDGHLQAAENIVTRAFRRAFGNNDGEPETPARRTPPSGGSGVTLSALQDENTRLSATLTDAQTANATLRSDLAKAQEENDALRSQVTSLTAHAELGKQFVGKERERVQKLAVAAYGTGAEGLAAIEKSKPIIESADFATLGMLATGFDAMLSRQGLPHSGSDTAPKRQTAPTALATQAVDAQDSKDAKPAVTLNASDIYAKRAETMRQRQPAR